jgi:DNA-binding GntR family transcriptional regulator
MNIEKISTRTLRQQVYDQLRKKIISAEIVPGQVMTLQGLAKEFGVSIMPVREALWQLESEKVIVIQSNKRIYVNGLKRTDLDEILRLRLILEPIAAESACERMTPGEMLKIKHILDGMEAALDKPKKYVVLNNRFHFAIYAYADSPILLDIIDSLWARIGPYINIAWERAGDHSLVMKSHRGMYEALMERDGGKLKEWLREDLTQAAGVITPFLLDSHQKEDSAHGSPI